MLSCLAHYRNRKEIVQSLEYELINEKKKKKSENRKNVDDEMLIFEIFGGAVTVDGPVGEKLDNEAEEYDDQNGQLDDDVVRNGRADVQPRSAGRHPVEELDGHCGRQEQDHQVNGSHRYLHNQVKLSSILPASKEGEISNLIFDGDGPQSGGDGNEGDGHLPDEQGGHGERREGADERSQTAGIETVQTGQVADTEERHQRQEELKNQIGELIFKFS